jgi:multidrug efflux system membrane fusion protein
MQRVSSLIVIAVAAVLSACTKAETAPKPAAPEVNVAQVISRPVKDYQEFTGHVEAVERVEIRPRVSGYISSVQFVEGKDVRKGDVLFVIDQRPYEAELKRVKAELARAVTAQSLAKSERERATTLLDLHAISREEFDARVAGSEQSGAQVQAAQAAVDAAELNMTFTQVRAPIAGLIGKAEVTPGNLVTNGQTLLTTLVSIDPVYVAFEGDEQQVLRHAGVRGASTNTKEPNVPVWIGLAGEGGYPHQGNLVFLNNEIDPATGTIRARGKFDNAERRFTPGMFVRLKLEDNERYDAVLIKDSAIGTDQSLRYVLVVDGDNRAQYRNVHLGPSVDGLRVVRTGLSAGERIVMNGLQHVRPGTEVAAHDVAMQEQSSDETRLAQNVGVTP